MRSSSVLNLYNEIRKGTKKLNKLKTLFAIILSPLLVWGCAPPGSDGVAGGFSPQAFLPFILIFVLFYFLIMRPQRKKQSQRQQMLEGLKRGDPVLTTGGIVGKIINAEGDNLTVEIAKGINVKMVRDGITGVMDQKTEEEKKS